MADMPNGLLVHSAHRQAVRNVDGTTLQNVTLDFYLAIATVKVDGITASN